MSAHAIAKKATSVPSSHTLAAMAMSEGMRKVVRRGLLGILGLALLMGFQMIWTEQFAADVGSSCSAASSDCRGFPYRDVCLRDGESRYCANRCDDDADCQAGWICVRAEYTGSDTHAARRLAPGEQANDWAFTPEDGVVRVCGRDAAAPAASHGQPSGD